MAPLDFLHPYNKLTTNQSHNTQTLNPPTEGAQSINLSNPQNLRRSEQAHSTGRKNPIQSLTNPHSPNVEPLARNASNGSASKTRRNWRVSTTGYRWHPAKEPCRIPHHRIDRKLQKDRKPSDDFKSNLRDRFTSHTCNPKSSGFPAICSLLNIQHRPSHKTDRRVVRNIPVAS